MIRTKSHFQGKEPILEKFLQLLRFQKVFPFVKKNHKVLDIGCGYKGTLLKVLSPNIDKGVGIDVSVTKTKIAKNVKLVHQNKARLPKEYFDLATCLAVIEHLDKPEKLLKIAYNSLKKNGKLMITTPSPIAKPILEFLSFKLGIVSKQEIKDHKKYYSKRELKNLLVGNGFKNNKIKISYFTFGVNIFAIAKK